jgi:hypothetical protein
MLDYLDEADLGQSVKTKKLSNLSNKILISIMKVWSCPGTTAGASTPSGKCPLNKILWGRFI